MKFEFWPHLSIQILHATGKLLLKMTNSTLFEFHLSNLLFCSPSSTFAQVTEFAEEGDLLNKIKTARAARRYFSEDVIWIYFIQMCRAIAFLHKQNVLHRVCFFVFSPFFSSLTIFDPCLLNRTLKAQMYFCLLAGWSSLEILVSLRFLTATTRSLAPALFVLLPFLFSFL